MHEFPQLKFSVSATTRQPRKHEKNGVHYHFLSKTEFQKRIKADEFLEWESFYDDYYGTLCSEVDKITESGYFCVLDIEVKGAGNVKNRYGDNAFVIFISPPDLQTLRQRLINRGTENEASLNKRLERAEMEMSKAYHFDGLVINDELEEAYFNLKSLVQPFIT